MNFAQALIGMAGVYCLVGRFGARKLPLFVKGVKICIVFATLLARAYSVMKSRTIDSGPGDANFVWDSWAELAMPFRGVSSALCTLAHWFLTAQYFRLAITIPVIF